MPAPITAAPPAADDLRRHGAILLVSCYELGHQPLSLASPLAHLARAGYAPVAVDTSLDELSDEAISAARLVAISVPMHTALRLGTAVAARVRSVNPSAHIAFYGLYALLNAGYLLDGRGDSVIGGEYEEPLLGLVRALETGAPVRVPGVGTRQITPHAAKLRTPFAVPDRSSLPPLSRYARLMHGGTTTLAGYAEASRGCLHTCLHCPLTPVYGGRFFVVPREVVLEDVRRQVAAGAGHVTFGDPDFLNGPGHSMKLVRELHAEFPHVTWDATIKIEHILEKRELFPEMRALGCVFVVSAVESLSAEVLRRLDKGHTREDVAAAIAVTRGAGISLRPSLLPFTPWTTLADYLELLLFFETERMLDAVDPVQFGIRLLVPPGSALTEDLERDGLLGPLDAASYTYQWRHPDPRLDTLQREVARVAEEGERSGEDPVDTFYSIRDTARRVEPRSDPLAGALAAAYPRKASPPRLTESWFC